LPGDTVFRELFTPRPPNRPADSHFKTEPPATGSAS
jgi:hypothetical protein